ncbi:MAG TPA: Gfo/Idh/MocA family oxidoreductase [Ignavibacteriaceae bacterium]|jgi:predicted dehydrogenase|nr:MAG: putative oxidoreductase YdgJ [Ignavibacteria bacterium ADurb.Bin266]HQF41633.1 Gfo/Idh/MocA family oxidoreductase [Ignavibacteriaceae bacterium]HQI39534.1 Gfo/Idh/MocA family oxidoreductase [Ignavibacteriaceae bacterium]HQJ45130.1 Gfo/Idh/MocA family oxidoreductase [Ignavibacteriaceae bacterium]
MYKGAIIGFGKIAQTNHLDAYRDESIKDRAKIVAAVEPAIENYEENKKNFPEIRFYTSFEELISNETIDFVDITSPPEFHFDLIKKGIENNLHIICEKPFVLNLNQAEEIKKMLLENGNIFIPCHQYKYSPVWINFKKFIDEQSSFNKVLTQFNVFRLQADPGLQSITNKWRTASPEKGGGVLIDTAIHYLYLVNWMFGKPLKISSHLSTLTHSTYKSEDTAVIIYESQKGIAQVSVTWAANKRHNDAKAVCSSGSLFYESGNKMFKTTVNGIEEIIVPDASEKSHYSSLYTEMFSEFFDALDNKEQNLRWIDEAYQSIFLLNECIKNSELNNVEI